jgi:S1-C subfamily serine protease
MRISILGFIIGLIVQIATAETVPDPLPRRGYFGVALEQSSSGARVTGVAPGSTAAAAGIAAGDVIVAIDGRDTATTEAGGRSYSEIATARPTSSSFLPRASGCALSARRRAVGSWEAFWD